MHLFNKLLKKYWRKKKAQGRLIVHGFDAEPAAMRKALGDSDSHPELDTRVYPKVFGLAAWSENCKLYSCLPLGAIVSLFFESV
jgi:hypothetical protein